jgi:hypothetical protein
LHAMKSFLRYACYWSIVNGQWIIENDVLSASGEVPDRPPNSIPTHDLINAPIVSCVRLEGTDFEAPLRLYGHSLRIRFFAEIGNALICIP